MAIHSSTGTCLSVSASLPATHTAAGYQALAFTQVGELESVNGLEIRRETGTFTNLCSGNATTIKGARQAITVAVVCGLDEDDAGQVLMIASEADMMPSYSFRIVRSNGAIDYFQGTVITCGKTFGSGTDAVKAPYDIAVVTPTGAAHPIVTAPPPAPATGVTVAPTTATVAIGATQTLTAAVSPAGANQAVTWTSSNPAVATVSTAGVVTGVADGTATITATSNANGALSAASTVTVS